MQYIAGQKRTYVGRLPETEGMYERVSAHIRCAHCMEELGRDDCVEVKEELERRVPFWLHRECAGCVLQRAMVSHPEVCMHIPKRKDRG